MSNTRYVISRVGHRSWTGRIKIKRRRYTKGQKKYKLELQKRATNPTIRDDIRGKTLKELGVVASTTTTEQQQQQQGRRNTQEQLTFNYFSVSLKRAL